MDVSAESVSYARELRALYRSAEQRAVRFRMLVEVGRDLASARGLATLLPLALTRATTFSGYDAGAVALPGPGETLRVSAVSGLSLGSTIAANHPIAATLWRALHERRPLVIDGPPDAWAEVAAAVVLPLLPGDGQALGALLLTARTPLRPPDRDDLDALQLLASQLAAAIESAQLNEEKARLLAQLLGAQEEERRRVAYELHDGLAQMSLGVLQQLHTLADRYRPRAPGARQALARAVEMARATVGEARRVIAGLRPTVLDDFGLATALRLHIAALREEGWAASYDERLGERRLPSDIETALFRVAQEALTNVRKHAGTTRVHLALWLEGGQLHLEIRDWGRGLAPPVSEAGAQRYPAGRPAPGERIGLLGMQERIRMLGGSWQIAGQAGAGTTVRVSVPLPSTREHTP